MIKEREQKVINKRQKTSHEFKNCIFCGAEEIKNFNSSGFYKDVLYNAKEINDKKYLCANYICKICGSRWLGDWYLE